MMRRAALALLLCLSSFSTNLLAAPLVGPGYNLQLELGVGGESPMPISMTVAENKTATMRIGDVKSPQLAIEVTVTEAAPNQKSGAPQAQIATRVFQQQGDAMILVGEPNVTVALGKIATIEVSGGTFDKSGASQPLSLRVSASRIASVDAGRFKQCTASAAEVEKSSLATMKTCGENCCCVSCQDGSHNTLSCCGGCCSACGSSCCPP